MLVEFESFFYEYKNSSWYFRGSDLLFNTEVKNIGVLQRLKNKFKV